MSGKAHYNMDWAGTIDPLAATTPPKESMAAANEEKQYQYARVGAGPLWAILHEINDEKDQVYFVTFDKGGISCTCGEFASTKERCRHIIAVSKLGSGRNDIARDEAMGAMLMTAGGWTVNEEQVLIPPDGTVMPAKPVAAKPEPKKTPAPEPEPEPEPKKTPAPEPKKKETEVSPPPPPPEEKPAHVPKKKAEPPVSMKVGNAFNWIEGLVEHGVGQIFGDTGSAKTAICREIAEQAAAAGKKVIYWDSEGNMTRLQREAMEKHKNIRYVLDRDWNHIKSMMDETTSKNGPKLQKCDLFILDSIGVPVLGVYGTMKQNQQGAALLAMQGLLYQLTVWAEKYDAVVIVTNQPVSEMNKTKEQIADRHPFGDKAMFFTKEILKLVVAERNEYKTVCNMLAWRSRSAGRGKMLATITISDKGTSIEVTK